MKDTSIRRIETLRLIPRAPHWITTSDLVQQLNEIGHEISKRTIQRDLIELSITFPLQYEVDGRTNRWRWSATAEVLDLPGMNPTTALSFFLAEQYLYEMLPPTATASLEPHFNKAREVLRQSQSKKMDRWIDKVRIVPEAQRLIPPALTTKSVESIYSALLEEKPFSANYKKKGDRKATHYEIVHPLGLVFRNRVIYLVATLWDYENPVQLALHRFTTTVILQDKALNRPRQFSLDDYVDAGNFDYVSGEAITLELLFSKESAAHLFETPLSRQQTLTNTRDGRVRLKAQVQNTHRLRWWIRGFGASVEVVKPVSLRREFIELAQLSATLYGI